MVHHVLLAEVGVEASQKYDAVADDYHEGFKEKDSELKEAT
jgi:hypothetical protein